MHRKSLLHRQHPAAKRELHNGAQMIGSTISHYTILEKLGEVRKWPTSVVQRVDAIFSIPPQGGSCTMGHR